MRIQLVLACVGLCLATFTEGNPLRGQGGRHRKGSGEGRKDAGCTSVCSLTNQTSSVDVAAECKEGFQCLSGSLDFLIRDDKFSASFCVRVEEEDDDEESAESTTAMPLEPLLVEEPQPVDNEKYIKFLLRRACSVINATSGEERTRRCPRGLNCSLSAVGVDDNGDLLTATYCQDDQMTADWMQVFNGKRRGDSSEESDSESDSESDEESDEDESAEPQRFRQRGNRRGGSRRPRRDVRGGARGVGVACNITDAVGAEIASAPCPEESACSVGPVLADDNGAAINIFFCEKPEKSSEESSDESSASEDEDDVEDEEEDEEEDEDEDFDHLARKMFCNACSLTRNGTDVDVRVMCPGDEDCVAGPFSTDIHGTEVVAKFCSTGEDFSLIQALQCRRTRKGGKGGKGGPRRRKGQKGARRGSRL